MLATERELLERAIIRAVAYFDVFEYPLTAAEVWRWLYRGAGESWNATPAEVRERLGDLVGRHRLEQAGDFFALPGRTRFVEQRQNRKVIGAKKWKRAKTAARFLEVIPYVRMVAVGNTLAIDNARHESDIDFFIVTAPGRIWMARYMITGLIEMLGYRRHDQYIKDRVCLSFYVTSSALDLTPLKREPEDHYLSFWAAQVVPLMDDKIYAEFRSANATLTQRLPNAWVSPDPDRLLRPNRLLRGINHSYGRVFSGTRADLLEGWARGQQHEKIVNNPKSKVRMNSTDVVVSEDVLKFHEADRRVKYNLMYRLRCEAMDVPV